MTTLDLATSDAWLWLGASLLLAVLWTNLTWLFSPWVESARAPRDSESIAERAIVQLATWRFAPALYHLLRLSYYVGLPFAALFWGHDAVVARFLGLQMLVLPTPRGLEDGAEINANWGDWGHDIGWAAALFVCALGVLLVAGWARRQALGTRPHLLIGTTGWDRLREAAYHETHWAFYRSIPIAVFGIYWGSWTGLLLAALEALANPVWRKRVLSRERSAGLLLRAALAVVSCLLFLRTQNLWLAIPFHWGIASGVRWLYPGRVRALPEGTRIGT